MAKAVPRGWEQARRTLGCWLQRCCVHCESWLGGARPPTHCLNCLFTWKLTWGGSEVLGCKVPSGRGHKLGFSADATPRVSSPAPQTGGISHCLHFVLGTKSWALLRWDFALHSALGSRSPADKAQPLGCLPCPAGRGDTCFTMNPPGWDQPLFQGAVNCSLKTRRLRRWHGTELSALGSRQQLAADDGMLWVHLFVDLQSFSILLGDAGLWTESNL